MCLSDLRYQHHRCNTYYSTSSEDKQQGGLTFTERVNIALYRVHGSLDTATRTITKYP